MGRVVFRRLFYVRRHSFRLLRTDPAASRQLGTNSKTAPAVERVAANR